jgi:ABC-2 type transport system ATP-binding protein
MLGRYTSLEQNIMLRGRITFGGNATRKLADDGAVIDMQNVSKQFGDKMAVRNVTLAVPEGQIFGLVGPSGCGKTTTIRMLTGVYVPTEGILRVLGETPKTFDRRARERIGYMPQLFVLYPTLTVWENLNFVASMYGLLWWTRRKRLNELLDFVELTPARNTLASNISGGMKRRLELACSLVHNPDLLFADEPTAGVDPVLRGKFWEHFRSLKQQGHSLLITTQYVAEVAHCDRVAVMRNGRLLMVDTPSGLRRRALGGEVIRLSVDAEDELNARRVLHNAPFVQRTMRPSGTPAGTLDVFVDDAGARLSEIIRALNEDPTIDTRNVEEYQPPFDDVFVTLMQQAAAADPEAEKEIVDA